MTEQQDLPNKLEIQRLYESYAPVFNEVLANIEAKLKSSIKIASIPTFKTRIKSFTSYYKKILRQKPKEAAESKSLVTLTDMIGIRVICAFLEDLDIVEQQLVTYFNVKEIERKGAQQSFREFGYESVHVLIAIPEDCKPKKELDPPLPDEVVCEIQIRTILQDAWAEVEHELIYKSEFNPFDKPLRRKLASINASLTLADTIFQEIRDYQNRLQSELGTRRNTFYNKADDFTNKEFGLPQENRDLKASAAIYSPQNDLPYSKKSIDELVLSALHEHNLANFDKAIEIYTQIINSKPTPPPVVLGVIYKHRGMAYFAQSMYDKALEDFRASVADDPKGFRALYYEGIVCSVQDKNQEAIECFNKSLEIDAFQSHVYYRRALAYFNLGEYKKSLADIASAENLGLNDEEVKALKTKVLKKFDMGM
ncbi:MAG: tetratricopeptide repeat protein [Treponema sp.]|nr:tetratricopeptide repeat protein [Treponema sp.]MBQ1794334.1 tetratricopeptide repeat protein [Treponema sp.]MBQ2354301.1 tetratricopeptide repeat protein [Treponema sp.]MBQ5449438.1 tetratricopeptide repeat protein [Treponema sp.]MBQ5570956.1 tetratricopeptide repeat protein [Treponema sp.]